MEVGVEFGAETVIDARAKLAAKYSASYEDIKQSTVMINSQITDHNKYSELYCYVDYQGKNNGELKWIKNDLDLTYTSRWAEGSEMIVDVEIQNFEDTMASMMLINAALGAAIATAGLDA